MMDFLNLPDISQPVAFAITALLISFVVIVRYLLIAGIFYVEFYWWFPEKWAHRKLSKRRYRKNQFRNEVGWSMLSATIFGLAGAVLLLLWQNNQTKIYTQTNAYPLWWLPLSLVITLFLHETYY